MPLPHIQQQDTYSLIRQLQDNVATDEGKKLIAAELLRRDYQMSIEARRAQRLYRLAIALLVFNGLTVTLWAYFITS